MRVEEIIWGDPPPKTRPNAGPGGGGGPKPDPWTIQRQTLMKERPGEWLFLWTDEQGLSSRGCLYQGRWKKLGFEITSRGSAKTSTRIWGRWPA
jgi:hypothetical protein